MKREKKREKKRENCSVIFVWRVGSVTTKEQNEHTKNNLLFAICASCCNLRLAWKTHVTNAL